MDMVFGASMVAAFIAGAAALFAPCCITVLLPSYLANVFRSKFKVFWMTFVFFLGILTVFLPIGLGASGLAQFFNNYHNTIFTIGGIFLMVLGLSMIFGKGFKLPMTVKANFKKYVNSVYLLGIFSAIATMCCAPVLAGVLALTVTSGSALMGGIYTLSYVLGMVVPLFVIAAFLDKVDLTNKLMGLKRVVNFKVGGINFRFVWAEVVSGLVFFSMGAYITYLAVNNRLFRHSDFQLSTNLFMANLLDSINGFVRLLPEYVWAVIVVLIFVSIIILAIKQMKKDDKEQQ
ncbi:MAG: cytochrome c biogenesis CcdA family protein [bacterium]|nr:cytochrome c biogenesis CcdA family protein [bacterium]